MRNHRAAPCKHHHTWGFLFFPLSMHYYLAVWCGQIDGCFVLRDTYVSSFVVLTLLFLCHAHNCINTYAKIHCSLFAGAWLGRGHFESSKIPFLPSRQKIFLGANNSDATTPITHPRVVPVQSYCPHPENLQERHVVNTRCTIAPIKQHLVT